MYGNIKIDIKFKTVVFVDKSLNLITRIMDGSIPVK